MRSDTFRKWLQQRGCRFDQQVRGAGAAGHAALTVHRGTLQATLPLVGTKQHLDPRVVQEVVRALELDPTELPGPQSRV
jgi:hypothetical protein